MYVSSLSTCGKKRFDPSLTGVKADCWYSFWCAWELLRRGQPEDSVALPTTCKPVPVIPVSGLNIF